MTDGWIGPEDPAWRAFLERAPHDFYHLPGYVALTAGPSNVEPTAFLARSPDAALFVPLHLRRLPEALGAASEFKDALSPYGYPTPLLIAPEGERAAARAGDLMAAFVEAARAAGLVTVFLRLHPLLPLPEEALRSVGTLVEHGPTVSIDLTEPDRFWTETNNGHRLGVRKLEKAGFEVRFDDWPAFDDFLEIYRLTMEHVNATQDYFFDRAYFEGLREALGDTLHLCSIHAPDGTVAAAGLFPETNGLVQNHLSGTHPSFRKQAPSKFLLHHVRLWAAKRGDRWFHLGGGIGGSEDSLFAFKAGFSKGRTAFRSLRIIVDPARNAELNKAWAARHGAEAEPEGGAAGFFPAYRRPPPSP